LRARRFDRFRTRLGRLRHLSELGRGRLPESRYEKPDRRGRHDRQDHDRETHVEKPRELPFFVGHLDTFATLWTVRFRGGGLLLSGWCGCRWRCRKQANGDGLAARRAFQLVPHGLFVDPDPRATIRTPGSYGR